MHKIGVQQINVANFLSAVKGVKGSGFILIRSRCALESGTVM